MKRRARSAADQGFAYAQLSLGNEYELGRAVPQDAVEAYKWYILAGASLPTWDDATRERIVQARDALSAGMSMEQVSEAQRLARAWKPMPAAGG